MERKDFVWKVFGNTLEAVFGTKANKGKWMEQYFIEQLIEQYVIEQLIEQYFIEQLIEQYVIEQYFIEQLYVTYTQ